MLQKLLDTKLSVETLLLIFIFMTMLMIVFVLLSLLFGNNSSSKQNARVKQFKKAENAGHKIDPDVRKRQLIDAITSPITDTIFEIYKPKSIGSLERKLHVTRWSKFFTPKSFMALEIICVIVALPIWYLLFEESILFSSIIAFIIIFSPGLLLNNEYKNIMEDILYEFPEVIRVISGYLSAGLIMTKAFELTAQSAKPRWKKLLLDFVAICEAEGETEALDWIKNEVDSMEAREFFASVRLSISNGISADESFDKQAAVIQQMLDDIIKKKIEKRKILGTILQGPLLLLILLTFALPIIGSITDFFSAIH